MSDPINASSGAEHANASGEGSGEETPNQAVPYGTYQRVLSEKKKFQNEHKAALEKLKEFEDAKASAEREQEVKKGNFTALEKQLRDEIAARDSKISEFETGEVQRKKAAAILSAAKGSLKTKGLNLIDLDKVLLDSEGNVDEVSVQKTLKSFKSEWPEMFQEQGSGKLPPNAPKGNQGGDGTIAYDTWKKLDLKDRSKYKPSDIVG